MKNEKRFRRRIAVGLSGYILLYLGEEFGQRKIDLIEPGDVFVFHFHPSSLARELTIRPGF